MPIPSKKTETEAPPPVYPGGGLCHSHGHSGGFGRKILLTLVGVLLAYLIFLVGTLIHNNIKKYYYIGQADQMERTVTVNGFGKVVGSNDIAVTSIGYSNTDKDIAKAQTQNKQVMDKVMAELKQLGIAENDLQTNYSIYPDYNYTPEKGQELRGYRVTNLVTVKIRDLNKIPAVLSLAGKYGANEVGGLSFTIDDPENLKQQAREKAWVDAQRKADRLAAALGVRLAAVVSYYENEVGEYTPLPYAVRDGLGGGPEAVAAPTVAVGSREVAMTVSITYKIVPQQ